MALTQIPIELSSTPSIVDGGNATAITINSSEEVTFAAKVTAVGTSVFTNLDISGDIDVDGTTNLDVVDIDGAVNMASTLVVNGTVLLGTSSVIGGAGGSGAQLFVKQASSSNGISSVANSNNDYVRMLHTGTIGKIESTYGTGGSYTPLTFITSNAERMRIDAAGITTFTKSGGGNIRIAETASRYVEIMGYAEGSANGSTMAFSTIQTGTSTSTERMRIDSSGDVMVGSSTNLNVLSGTPKIQIGKGDGHASLQFYSANNTVGAIYFGDSNSGVDRYDGYIEYRHNNRSMAFRVGAADHTTMHANGHMQLYNGDLILASGHGIDFSATGDASGKSAELLDDYEEGSFTPRIYAVSGNAVTGHTVNEARYTKIGQQVSINMYISAINMALLTSGSYVNLDGLPFGANGYADFQFTYHRGGNTFVGGYIQSGQPFLYFCDVNGTEIQQTGNALLTAFIASAHYTTSS